MSTDEMIAKFLANGGEVKQCDNKFDEYSKHGGKTRSHLGILHTFIISSTPLFKNSTSALQVDTSFSKS